LEGVQRLRSREAILPPLIPLTLQPVNAVLEGLELDGKGAVLVLQVKRVVRRIGA
jgi:hypothetical protein